MVLKKMNKEKARKTNPLIGILLFLVATILLITTGLFGFIYGLLQQLLTKGAKGIGEYTLQIAISIDQLGNVIMQHLLNLLWIKKDGYLFGNRDETISSVIGKNKLLNTLTNFGRLMDKILDIIDTNHSLNSIDYYIEPTKNR